MTDRERHDNQRIRRHLDARARQLTVRHQERLQQMTAEAVEAHRRRRRFILPNRWVAVPAATAFVLALALGLALNPQHRAAPPTQATASSDAAAPADPLANLPEWVKDTDTPVDLLENYAFYRWLATQQAAVPDQNSRRPIAEPRHATDATATRPLPFDNAKTSAAATARPVAGPLLLAFNADDESGHRRGHSTADAAARLPRTTATAGEAQ